MMTAGPSVLRIGACSLAEARGLLSRHYAPGMPARVCRVLGAWLENADGSRGAYRTHGARCELVGVLTVSHPTLNDRWRASAWPGVYDMADKRERARLLNATVRRISRVVVLPRQRGRGIATALVRAYLRRPLTARTEVVAAMGDLCCCFERAGMRRVECGVSARDVTLANGLKGLQIAPELLADERAVERLARDARFVKAIRTWANAAGATRRVLRCADAVEKLAPSAARAVVSISEGGSVWVSEMGAIVSEAKERGERGVCGVARRGRRVWVGRRAVVCAAGMGNQRCVTDEPETK